MSKKKKFKPKYKSIVKKKGGPTKLAWVLLGAGVVVAVVGSTTIPTLISEERGGLAIFISIGSLAVGITLAILGLRRFHTRKKRKSSGK